MQPAASKKDRAEQQLKIARSNLLLMVGLTVVNVVLFLLGTETMLLFSATVPYLAVMTGVFTENTPFLIATIIFAAIILGLYLLCWAFSKKHYGWMITALVLFILDTLVMGGIYLSAGDFSGVLDVLIHAWVLYYLIIGVKSGHTLQKLASEEWATETVMPQEAMPPQNVPVNTMPLRLADTDSKARLFIEGDFAGCHVVYRRVKRTNELVINGYVYDEVEMLVEPPHALRAGFNGHLIEVGYNGTHSYISIDGQQAAQKLRLA